MVMNKLAIFLLLIAAALPAQEFGFGFGDEKTSSAGSMLNVSIGGEVSTSITGYIDNFSEGAKHIELGDLFSGKLNFSAKTSIAEGIINLNLQPSSSPASIDEAYLRAYFGNFEIAAGLRKLTWGKADSLGPLDVINPLDTSKIYTEMADNTSLMGVKIARPLVHASFRFGQFSKIEAVFVPSFEPYYIASDGRWAPAQMKIISEMLDYASIYATMSGINIPAPKPVNTGTLDYAQAGLRYTTTAGPADFGVQYYYGRLPQPAAKFSFVPPSANFIYNPYHQIGLDYAQVLSDFNVRAEVAANITEDLKGDDASVYNPSIAWSFGFDRDIFLGINLNLQVNESIRLMHDKLGSGNISLLREKLGSGDIASVLGIIGDFDIEGDSELTATRLTAALSRKFLRDELELRTAIVWGIEDNDCLIMPALMWTKDDIRIALSGGIFAGDKKGQLGQYKDNNFLKISMTYKF
jgi:hypothetical protein